MSYPTHLEFPEAEVVAVEVRQVVERDDLPVLEDGVVVEEAVDVAVLELEVSTRIISSSRKLDLYDEPFPGGYDRLHWVVL